MNKKFKFASIVCAAALTVSAMVGCGGGFEDGMPTLDYPDFPDTPGDKNSWEYIADDNDMTIDWYVDVSSWPIPADNSVLRKIKEDTGITIRFMTPVTDDGQKLATIIAGDDMPDVISVPTANARMLAQLAQQGYVYDIDTLAQKWAPTLTEHYPEDVREWWAYGNGKTYGIPNHYYSYNDVPEGKLQPNGGMMVRKDIFDAWQAHVEADLKDADGKVTYTGSDSTQKSVEWQGYITTPEGFKEAAKWAMEHYYGTANGKITTALQLNQFTSSMNTSLTWLAQFFAVPFEDRDGNYVYQFTTEAYEEVLYYLNDLYRTKVNGNSLISTGNFTQNYDSVGSIIAGGKAFATLVTPQDYQMHYVTAKDGGAEYVSLFITNEAGDAPVLADIRGYGYLMNMITTDCERPDIVVKLFDYLTSPQGQKLVCFGVEGETWNSGANGEVVFTETYLNAKSDPSQTVAGYGLMTVDMLINYQYYDNVQPQTNNGKTASELFRTNLKRPLSVYAYDYNVTHFVVDATDENFMDYNNALTRIDSLIGTQIPKILQAAGAADAKSIYDSTLTLLKARNLDLVVEMNAKAYKKAKEKLGVTTAWPLYQPDYVSPLDRTKPNGDLTLYRTY